VATQIPRKTGTDYTTTDTNDTIRFGDGSSALASILTVEILFATTGTVDFKGSMKDGRPYALNALPLNSTTAVTQATTSNIYRVDATGLTFVDLVISANDSGITVNYRPAVG
jgi:hypothetical protein